MKQPVACANVSAIKCIRTYKHVANSGDWLVICSSNDKVAFFERAGSRDELFRKAIGQGST